MVTKKTLRTCLQWSLLVFCLASNLPAQTWSYSPRSSSSDAAITSNDDNHPEGEFLFASVTGISDGENPAFPTELMPASKPITIPNHGLKTSVTYTAHTPLTTRIQLGCVYDEQQIKLNWITPSEYNIDQFVVKRTTDGINFTQVGITPSQGHGQITQKYQIADAEPVNGLAYYCLYSKDIDGNLAYWGYVESNLREKPVLRTRANPGKQEDMKVDLNFIPGKSVDWVLLDTDGQFMAQGHDCLLQAGGLQLNMVDLPKLQPGLYLLQVSGTSTTFTRKLIVTGH